MLWGFKQKIWLYQQPIDFRKQINGLMITVADVLKGDPVSGQLFIFRNHRANQIKLLWWDTNGFWLMHKKLEKGRFKYPKIVNETYEMSSEQFNALLSGLDFQKQNFFTKITANRFY